MATETNSIAKIGDFYNDMVRDGVFEAVKDSWQEMYGTFTESETPGWRQWNLGLCPSKSGWMELYMRDIVTVNGTYEDNNLVKFSDITYALTHKRSFTFQVDEYGWLNPIDQSFRLELSASINSTYICYHQTFISGANGDNEYEYNGKTTSLGTVRISENQSFKIWVKILELKGTGRWTLRLGHTGEILGQGYISDMSSTETSPLVNIQLYSKLDDFDDYNSVILELEAEDLSGMVTPSVTQGGWVPVSSTISGYDAYQSNSNYHKHRSVSICRVYTSGKSGPFTIYIGNNSEKNYDYTVAGILDTALPTKYSSSYPSGAGSSKGKNIQLDSDLSKWTAVTYDIPDENEHWIDVAYIKDVNGSTGEDRGYLLVPIEW